LLTGVFTPKLFLKPLPARSGVFFGGAGFNNRLLDCQFQFVGYLDLLALYLAHPAMTHFEAQSVQDLTDLARFHPEVELVIDMESMAFHFEAQRWETNRRVGQSH